MGWIDSTKVDWILFKHSGSLKDLSPLGTKLRDFSLALIVKLRDFFKGPCRTFEDFGRILRVSRLCLGILPCTDCEMEGFLMDSWRIFPISVQSWGISPCTDCEIEGFFKDSGRILPISGHLRDFFPTLTVILRDS